MRVNATDSFLRVCAVSAALLIAAACACVRCEAAGEGEMREIVVIPIGIAGADRLAFLRAPLEKAFGLSCRLAQGIPLPRGAYNEKRGQYLSTAILGRLESKAGEGTLLVGVANVDLYVPDLNFVFGEARMGGAVCVISLFRLRQETYGLPPDERLFERRAATEAVHELGHVMGLAHCPDPRCVMYFSNSLEDTDRKGSALCPRCRGKIGGRS